MRTAEKREISVDPLKSKGFFWLSRPRIRSSRSCWWVGMDVRFVCVIRVPVSRVNVNTTDATTGATALDHSCVSRLPFVYQNGNDHEAARTHSLDSCEPFFLSRIARSSLSSGAALWENHFSESLGQPIHGRGVRHAERECAPCNMHRAGMDAPHFPACTALNEAAELN